MQKPKKLRKEQLDPDYQPPHRTDGFKQVNEDGSQVSRPAFTTSAKAHAAQQDRRPENTDNSTGFASSTTNTDVLPGDRPMKKWRYYPSREIKTPEPPPQMTYRQKKLIHPKKKESTQ